MEEIETISKNGIKPYKLKNLPPKINYMNEEIFKELLDAKTQIAELKGYCLDFPNPYLLLFPAIIKESLASSEIEDIHTTLIDVLQNALLPESERREADKEVLRYREAIIHAFNCYKNKQIINSNLVIEIQNKLMQVDDKSFRRDQNAIINERTKEIVFVPPASDDIKNHMKNWEEYVNNNTEELKDDPLIKTAIAHYQFESIHPFSDGNGRTGRILMVLQLISSELLTAPILYISGYINENKSEYYRLLREVTNNGKWSEYILFMLKGMKVQSIATKTHLLETKSLFENIKKVIKEKLPSIYSYELVEAIFSSPVITPTVLANKIDKHYVTAGSYLKRMEEIGILKSYKYGKYQMYGNIELIKLLNN